jgi:hypothetical protein
VLILSLGIESVSLICADLPFRPLVVVELVSDVIVGPFGSLLSVAIYDCHIFGNKLFGFCISRGSSERKLWRCVLFALLHLSES